MGCRPASATKVASPRAWTRNRAALDLIAEAVGNAGLTLGTDIALAMDVAASEFYDGDAGHYLRGPDPIGRADDAYYEELIAAYPIVSIEDPLNEDDWAGWSTLTAALGDKVQVVGDDLLRDERRAASAGHRRAGGKRAAGEGQPDRQPHRDDRRGRPGPPRLDALHDEPPLGRDGGHDDRRPRGRHQLRTDQDRARRRDPSGWPSTTSSCGSRRSSRTPRATPVPEPSRVGGAERMAARRAGAGGTRCGGRARQRVGTRRPSARAGSSPSIARCGDQRPEPTKARSRRAAARASRPTARVSAPVRPDRTRAGSRR